MKPNLPVLALLGSLLPASAGSSEVRPQLRLVWVDPTSAVPFAYAGMSREVRSILGAAGVDVVWDKRVDGVLATGEVAVIVLNAESARVGLRPQVMGCVGKGDGRSALWVNLSTVAWALGLDPRSRVSWSVRERHQVATALGRVVAHEVVHLVAPQISHTTEGLLSTTLNRSHLVHQRPLLDAESADGFLRGIRLRDTTLPADGPVLVLSRSR